MNIEDYQVNTKVTAIYPGVNQAKNGNLDGVMYTVLGLNGEAGEVAEVVKKLIRDKGSVIDDDFIAKMRGELGDVFYYLVRLCSELDLDARDIMQENIDKLFSRKSRGVLTGSGSNR